MNSARCIPRRFASRYIFPPLFTSPSGDSCIIWKRAWTKQEVFYLVSKWDDNLVFNSRHLLIHLNLVSTLSQLLIVSPAKISGFISWEILQAHGYNLLPRSLVDDASSTRDLRTRLGWMLAKRQRKKKRRRYPATLIEQVSIGDKMSWDSSP